MISDYVAKGINVSCRTIDGEAFIFDEDTRNLLRLDKVGSFIWDQIDGLKTIEEILAICCHAFTDDEENIRKAVLDFINDLQENNVVVFAGKAFEGVMISVY